MSDVKRYEAVHLRYEDSNIRYGEGCEVEVVTASDYAALEAEADRLRTEAEALWSTYIALVDKLGIDTEKAKTAAGKPSDVIVSYVDELRAENERLRQG